MYQKFHENYSKYSGTLREPLSNCNILILAIRSVYHLIALDIVLGLKHSSLSFIG